MNGITLFGINKNKKKLPSTSTKNVFLKKIDELNNVTPNNYNELWILTCYINFKIVTKFINDVKAKKNIDRVYLMFNAAEAYRVGIGEAKKILRLITKQCESKSIEFVWQAISTESSSLMHAKAYAFLQRNKTTEIITSGFQLVTSSNFTINGFYTASNIELGYFSKSLINLKKFENIYDFLWENKSIDITLKFDDNEEIFHFALLSYGIFLHRWTANINSLTGIQYKFTDDAIEQLKGIPDNPLLIRLNARTERESFNVSYLDFSNLPQKAFPKNFTAKYTVDTYLGYWCPKPVWTMVNKYISKDLNDYIKEFKCATSKKELEQAKKVIEQESNDLYEQKLIKGKINIENWEKRIKNLRNDTERLRRFHIGYEVFDMPYDYSDQENIDKLYESFENTLASIKKPINKNLFLVKKRAFDSIETLSLSEFKLTSQEKAIIKNKFG